MMFGDWFATRKVRQGATAAVVVLATGGLFLLRAHAAPGHPGAHPAWPDELAGDPIRDPSPTSVGSGGPTTVGFSGPHVRGTFALSNSFAQAGAGLPLYADVTLTAEAGRGDGDEDRAPLALVVVLDTSGSMEGEKLTEAKTAVKGLVRNMRDGDEIAFVRYSDSAETVQALAPVGEVRTRLAARVDELRAGGGTAIPLGLAEGLRALRGARGGRRVLRVVLVSDGLDASRPESERIARVNAEQGVTVSSMGIGLDFDEAYLGSLARNGHGNFGFVDDAPTLTAFLQRELLESATTTAESTVVHLHLPKGASFVKAVGAAAEVHERDVALEVGALYAREPKRVLVQLATDFEPGDSGAFNGSLTWKTVEGVAAEAVIPQLKVTTTSNLGDVRAGRNEDVLARVASVEASELQLEAAHAYAAGDTDRATRLIQKNLVDLKAAASAAPAPLATALARQAGGYGDTMTTFRSESPTSAKGRSAAKMASASNAANEAKSGF